MNLCLGMLVGPDEPLLERIIPELYAHNGIVAAVTGDTDRLKEWPFRFLIEVPALTNWAEARNKIIREAELAKFDYCLMLDCDEWIDVGMAKKWCKDDLAVRFPRIEFVGDSGHYDPSLFPDYQTRLFPLNSGFVYSDPIHESLVNFRRPAQVTWAFDCPIYHYGKCKDPDKVWLHQHNYTLMARGEPTLTELPANYVRQPVDTSKLRVWHGYQPIKISPQN